MLVNDQTRRFNTIKTINNQVHMTNTRMLVQDTGYDGILFHYLVACKQASSPGHTVSGAENGRRACNYVSEI